MPLPILSKIDFGANPSRTTKAITLRCNPPLTTAEEEDMSGNTTQFEERVLIDVAVRDIKAGGRRLGREPEDLVTIEKYLVDLLAINRLALRSQGIQYIDVLGTQTFSELEGGGGEENQQLWFHVIITVRLHYWMRAADE